MTGPAAAAAPPPEVRKHDVGVYDPLQPAPPGVQLVADGWLRDVHHRRIRHDNEEASTRDGRPASRKRAQEIYAPLAEQAAPLYERFTGEQLATVLEYLRIVTNEFYAAQIARVEALGRGSA